MYVVKNNLNLGGSNCSATLTHLAHGHSCKGICELNDNWVQTEGSMIWQLRHRFPDRLRKQKPLLIPQGTPR